MSSLGLFAVHLHVTRSELHFVNVAGRQRMLAAELHSWARMVAGGQEEDRPGLRERIGEFERAALALKHGGWILGAELLPPDELAGGAEALWAAWRRVAPHLTALAAVPARDPRSRRAFEETEAGLPGLRGAAHRLTAAAYARSARERSRMMATLSALALLMTGVCAFQFRAGRRVMTLEAAARAMALERRFSDVVESASDGLVLMEEDGLISGFNAAAERMFGWARV